VAKNFQLQDFPQAFLDILTLKTHGRAPGEFSDIVTGFLDMADHYLASRQTIGVADATVGVLGDRVILQVPAGEVWRVHAVSATMVIPAAASELMGRISYQPSAGNFRIALKGIHVSVAVGAVPCSVTESVVLDRPLPALPGSIIAFNLDTSLPASDVGSIRTFHEVIEL